MFAQAVERKHRPSVQRGDVPEGFTLVERAPKALSDSPVERKSVGEERKDKGMNAVLAGRLMKGREQRASALNLPPKINASVTVNHVFRFKSTVSTTVTVSVADLALICGGVATSGTSFTGWCSSFRVKSFKIWPAEGTVDVNAGVEWVGAVQQIGRDILEEEVLPNGITVTKCLTSRPPAKCSAADWTLLSSPTNVMALVTTASGSIIDVSLEFTLVNIFNGPSFTGAGFTAGAIYYGCLDQQGAAAYLPIGLPVIP